MSEVILAVIYIGLLATLSTAMATNYMVVLMLYKLLSQKQLALLPLESPAEPSRQFPPAMPQSRIEHFPGIGVAPRVEAMPAKIVEFAEAAVSPDGGTWAADIIKARARELYSESRDWEKVYQILQLDAS